LLIILCEFIFSMEYIPTKVKTSILISVTQLWQ
jgi:hypothetical protein